MTRRTLLASGAAAAALGGAAWAAWPSLDRYEALATEQRRALAADPTLPELVRLATLAPNGHNTQPWRFRLAPDRVMILPDFAGRTPVVDPDDHHLYVSLGCAAENLAVAARVHGREAIVTEAGEAGIALTLDPGAPADADLHAAIPQRQSTRAPYDGRPISAEDLAALERAVRVHGVDVALLTGPDDLDRVTELVVAGNAAQMADPAWVAELRDWLRFSPARAMETGDGLFSACSGNPAMPEWIGRRAFGMVFTEAVEAEKYRTQLASSSGVAAFFGPDETAEGWIQVGRAFERFVLRATTLGIRTAHVNQPVEVAALRADLAALAGHPGRRPDLLIRFGRGPALPMSLRRPVEAVLA